MKNNKTDKFTKALIDFRENSVQFNDERDKIISEVSTILDTKALESEKLQKQVEEMEKQIEENEHAQQYAMIVGMMKYDYFKFTKIFNKAQQELINSYYINNMRSLCNKYNRKSQFDDKISAIIDDCNYDFTSKSGKNTPILINLSFVNDYFLEEYIEKGKPIANSDVEKYLSSKHITRRLYCKLNSFFKKMKKIMKVIFKK